MFQTLLYLSIEESTNTVFLNLFSAVAHLAKSEDPKAHLDTQCSVVG